MIRLDEIHKSYGPQVLFEGASLQLAPGERLGLIGRNGSGKTTLFRLLLGQEEPDSGAIILPRNYRMGQLEQILKFDAPTVIEEGCRGLAEDDPSERYQVERILAGLGFTREDLVLHPAMLSSGFQVRLSLARTLVSHPNLLLLDEPTNYLDILSIRWIEGFLRGWDGELILISHDRDFMDVVCTHTAMIHRRALRKVSGGSDKIIAQIAQEEEVHERTRANVERQRRHLQEFVDRFKAKASKAAAARSKMKQIERLPIRGALAREADLAFSFHAAEFPAKTLMEARELRFGFRPDATLIDGLSFAINARDRIAVVGKNGRGKSTLLNLLAGELTPQGGEIRQHASARPTLFGQAAIDRLHPANTVEDEVGSANADLARTAVRSICGAMMFQGDAAEKKISVLSGGERSRVLLGKIIAQPANLLLLDEPTNHLDMQAIEALIEAVREFPGAVVLVTHNEMMLRELAERLIVFQRSGVRAFDGGYDDFIERIGWEEEREEADKKAGADKPPAINRRELRRQRSQAIAERSRAITPLKERMEAIEAEICRLEEEVTNCNHALIAASQSGDGPAIAAHSRMIKECQARIDALFDELSIVHREHDEQRRRFEEIMKQFE
ncbi:MAG: ABC-F family ATP-binding cassette domain-containing protein [bacterium]